MTLLNISDRDGALVVDSRLIAAELGIAHKNFLANIYQYLDETEEAFGVVAFESELSLIIQGRASRELCIFDRRPGKLPDDALPEYRSGEKV